MRCGWLGIEMEGGDGDWGAGVCGEVGAEVFEGGEGEVDFEVVVRFWRVGGRMGWVGGGCGWWGPWVLEGLVGAGDEGGDEGGGGERCGGWRLGGVGGRLSGWSR
jgi:hypothetical protein